VLELPWLVLQLYAKDHPESHLAKLLGNAVCAHVTTEPPKDELRFWVTSTTLHRGVPERVHGLEFINQTDPMEHPPIWVALARQGRSIGVFGASYSHAWKDAVPEQTAFYVPDKFAPDNWASPARAVAYQKMLRLLSRLTDQGHGKTNARLRGSLAILHFLLSKLVQLHLGAIRYLTRGWKLRILESPRAFVSARLAFYEFVTLWKAFKPDFSLFATGALATAMHKGISPYLRALSRDRSAPATPMCLALDELNAEVGMLLEMAARDRATLVVASGYGQAQAPEHDAEPEFQRFWLLHNPTALTQWLGLQGRVTALPAMLPCATLWFRTDADRDSAIEQLSQLRNLGDDTPLFHVETGVRCISLKATPDHASVRDEHVLHRNADGSVRKLPIRALGLVKHSRRTLTGEHSPGGVLLVHQHGGTGATWVPDIAVSAIAPTLMQALGADVPPGMQPVCTALFEQMGCRNIPP
jgi:hypothetical protein